MGWSDQIWKIPIFFNLTFPLQDALTITVERDEKYPTFVNHVFKTDEFSFKNAHYHGEEVRKT